MTKINDNVTDDDLGAAGKLRGYCYDNVTIFRMYPESYSHTIRIANLLAENRELRAKLPAVDKARMLARQVCEEVFPASVWVWPDDEESVPFKTAHAAILACEKLGFVLP